MPSGPRKSSMPAKARARNLDDACTEQIVRILDGWNQRLSWNDLIVAIEQRINVLYTRQTLSKHQRIKQAFQLTKSRISGLPLASERLDRALNAGEVQALMDRCSRLEGETARLKLENERFLEQFAVWAYNAHTRGLDQDVLNRELPFVDRGRTKQKNFVK